MNVQPLGLNVSTALLYFAEIGNVDSSAKGWEHGALSAAGDYYFVPRSSSAQVEVDERVEQAYVQFRHDGTVPVWVMGALKLLHKDLEQQGCNAAGTPPPPE